MLMLTEYNTISMNCKWEQNDRLRLRIVREAELSLMRNILEDITDLTDFSFLSK